MIYTETIQNKSKLVLITGIAKSLEDLIGAKPDPDVANLVTLFFIQTLVGANPIAWYTEDGQVTLAVDNGIAVYAGVQIDITKANFDTFKILKHSGPDFEMWCTQFDSETFTT